eukprot:3919767-Prymnesium_polylepis.1
MGHVQPPMGHVRPPMVSRAAGKFVRETLGQTGVGATDAIAGRDKKRRRDESGKLIKVIAMRLPCDCHAIAMAMIVMRLPCDCHVIVM